ncbi:hypothetical protein RHRU231_590038 [Rhodococcus ruber]|uniref:Uncharacterized protein n=1 Tax=Rhodococcus ruber TaxID=1830 RepID=A0A098BMM5_9NOCA|nr:hypothetical protein RHRU231_590038 [Rhodococcus ruber]
MGAVAADDRRSRRVHPGAGQRIPALRGAAPRGQHVRAVRDRTGHRTRPRPAPVPGRLPGVDPRRIRGSDAARDRRRHCRRLRRRVRPAGSAGGDPDAAAAQPRAGAGDRRPQRRHQHHHPRHLPVGTPRRPGRGCGGDGGTVVRPARTGRGRRPRPLRPDGMARAGGRHGGHRAGPRPGRPAPAGSARRLIRRQSPHRECVVHRAGIGTQVPAPEDEQLLVALGVAHVDLQHGDPPAEPRIRDDPYPRQGCAGQLASSRQAGDGQSGAFGKHLEPRALPGRECRDDECDRGREPDEGAAGRIGSRRRGHREHDAAHRQRDDRERGRGPAQGLFTGHGELSPVRPQVCPQVGMNYTPVTSPPPHGHDQADDHEPETDEEVVRAEVVHPRDLLGREVVDHQPGQADQHEAEHHRDVPGARRSRLHLHGGAAHRVDRVVGLLPDLRLGHDVLVCAVPRGADR